MAKALGIEMRIDVKTDDTGAPSGTAVVYYTVEDGEHSKEVYFDVDTPDFTKIMESTDAVGEFWKDVRDTIESNEGIV